MASPLHIATIRLAHVDLWEDCGRTPDRSYAELEFAISRTEDILTRRNRAYPVVSASYPYFITLPTHARPLQCTLLKNPFFRVPIISCAQMLNVKYVNYGE